MVDKFEEIFRFQPDNSDREYEASEFVGLLLAATQDYDRFYRFYTVITMRSDYLWEPASWSIPQAHALMALRDDKKPTEVVRER